MTRPVRPLALIAIVAALVSVADARAQQPLPEYLRDRGEGVTTSLFGTYVRGGELLVYPFYEYEKNTSEEYHGSELGFGSDTKDYLGELELHQVLLFLGYGVTDDVAVEVEAALWEKAVLRKAPEDDTSGIPDSIEESGFGEVETSLRWRMARESASRPEVYGWVEVGLPFQENDVLIGISDWEGGIGLGAVKGFSWGTMTPRISLEYDGSDDELEFGEWAVEYLKRASDLVRVVATVEGESDEISLIGELQLHLSPHAFVKLNSGFGLTDKAPDVAPEVGVMFVF